MVSEARRKAQRKYNQSEKGKAADKKYERSKKGKVTGKKYRQSEKGKIIFKKYQQSDKGKITGKKYIQSKKGAIVSKRRQAKRKRNLGFTPLMSNPFPDEIPVDYHHINNTFVIPVPRQVHKSMYGKNHRVKVNNWIEEVIGDVGVC